MSKLLSILRRSAHRAAVPDACSTGISGGSALTLRRHNATATSIPERDGPDVER